MQILLGKINFSGNVYESGLVYQIISVLSEGDDLGCVNHSERRKGRPWRAVSSGSSRMAQGPWTCDGETDWAEGEHRSPKGHSAYLSVYKSKMAAVLMVNKQLKPCQPFAQVACQTVWFIPNKPCSSSS